jgi:hypothetical protein
MADLLTKEQLETLGDIGQIVVGHLVKLESGVATAEALAEPDVSARAGPGTPRR